MSPEAVELDIHIHNDFALWKMHESVEATLAKKIVRGDYNPELAIKAWLNLVDRAARSYARDNRMQSRAFGQNLRRELATEFERRFYKKHMGMRRRSLSDAPRSMYPSVAQFVEGAHEHQKHFGKSRVPGCPFCEGEQHAEDAPWDE